MTEESVTEMLVHFDRLAPYISEALEYAEGTHSLDDVRQGIADGSLQLWPCPHSVAITCTVESPQTKTLLFFLAGGNLAELKPLYPIIEDWGRSVGCTRASFIGRKGWERTFLTKEEGWTTPLAYYAKDLTNG